MTVDSPPANESARMPWNVGWESSSPAQVEQAQRLAPVRHQAEPAGRIDVAQPRGQAEPHDATRGLVARGPVSGARLADLQLADRARGVRPEPRAVRAADVACTSCDHVTASPSRSSDRKAGAATRSRGSAG